MGKLSFRYRIEPEAGHMNAFRYQYENITEYGLAYQRYAALSDASIFNSPVGITKIAAGLSDLCSLFMIEKPATDTLDNDGTLVRHRHSIVPNDYIEPAESHKDIDDIRKRNDIFMHRPYYMEFYKETYAHGYDYLTANDISFQSAYHRGPDFSILPMYFLKGYDLTGNDYENIFTENDSLRMEIRHDILVSGETNHMIILKDTIAAPDTNRMEILKNILASGAENRGDYYDFSGITPPEIRPDEYENVYSRRPDPEFNIIENIFGWMPKPDMQILYQPEPYKSTAVGNVLEVDNVFRPEQKGFVAELEPIPHRDLIANYPYQTISSSIAKFGNRIDEYYAKPGNNIGNMLEELAMSQGINILDKFDSELAKKPMMTSNMFDMYIMSQHGKIANRLGTEFATPDGKTACDIDEMFFTLSSSGKVGYFFNPDTFGIQEIKYTVYVESVYGSKDEAVGFIETDYSIFGNKDLGMHGVMFDEMDKALNDSKSGCIYEAVSVFKYKGDAIADDSGIHAIEDIPDVFEIRTAIPIKYTKSGTQLRNMDSTVFLSRDNTMFGYFQQGVFSIKANNGLDEAISGEFIFRPPGDLFFDDEVRTGDKVVNGMFRNKDGSFAERMKVDMRILMDQEHTLKESRDMYLADNGYFIYRLPYDLMLIQNEIHGLRLIYDVDIMAKDVWFNARNGLRTEMEITDGLQVLRTVRYVQDANMIIPFSKINRQGMIDRIDEMAFRTMRKTDWVIQQDMWGSVIKKQTWMEDTECWLDKSALQTYIDYQNHWMFKDRLKTHIFDGMMSGDKTEKKEHVFRDEWVSKAGISNDIYDPPVSGIKEPKNSSLFKDEWVKKDASRETYRFEQDWFNKIPQLNYYAYGLMSDKNNLRDISVFNDESTQRKSKDMTVNFDSPVIRDSTIRIWLDEYIFTRKSLQGFDIYEQLEWLKKTRKKLGLHPNDIGNWAFAYETPDPIEPVYGIDELLLPENDTRYEDFKEIIFDKEKMRPRSPVKVIDDTTFIAKYPIRHPSKDHFKDLAIDYEASAYKWENYYGIKTEIMYICFLKYYRIWETKMFEFSTMTMQQSVNQMLEYMYAWMIDYFPLEELEEAFRVLRLIRWYGESAIIQNSQYIISYEYGILESKLTSGTCLVPNDLDTNDTMFVDASMGVIRNNPAYIRTGPAYVEFYIDNKKNTTFTFSLSNTVGSVNIYINDELVDQRPFTARNLTYPLNATGETNIIRIEKPAAHNLNDTFYIGNIRVPDCGFKDLTIEFDPKMRAGNKPLDAVAKKMVQFAQLHEKRDEVYDMIFKANLGISEVYKKLLEYWELHHANKVKGKRLTIKKC